MTPTIEQHAADCLGAALLDESMTLVDVSASVLEIAGYERADLIGSPGFELLHADDHQRAAEAILELLRTREPTTDGLYRMRFGDGSFHDYAVRAITTSEDGGQKTIMKFSAVTPALQAEEFTRDTVDTLRLVSESRQLDECLERVHLLAERHLRGSSMTITTTTDDAARTHRRQTDGTFGIDHQPLAPPPHVEHALAQHASGPWRAFRRMAEYEPTATGALVTSVLTDDVNHLLGYVEAFTDSTAEPDEREWMVHGMIRQVLTVLLRRLRLDEQLKHAADHDPLTGLANRRRLFDDMSSATDLAGTTLLLLDVDHFSWINNNLGHHIGDQTLRALATRLQELCPPRATIARLGGDEFVVWSPLSACDPVELDAALRITPLVPPGTTDRRASVRCSIGAITIESGEAAVDAIKRADAAMYRAKRAGGDRLHRS